jgi:hypothetical protein
MGSDDNEIYNSKKIITTGSKFIANINSESNPNKNLSIEKRMLPLISIEYYWQYLKTINVTFLSKKYNIKKYIYKKKQGRTHYIFYIWLLKLSESDGIIYCENLVDSLGNNCYLSGKTIFVGEHNDDDKLDFFSLLKDNLLDSELLSELESFL